AHHRGSRGRTWRPHRRGAGIECVLRRRAGGHADGSGRAGAGRRKRPGVPLGPALVLPRPRGRFARPSPRWAALPL
ncbi:MAG: hypothetical protein AVDCRST_MAG04-666, partial [uncultured Acetobacteraceae bacterium]